MPDGRSGQITAPEPGDYVLRYVIEHPTAGRHMILAQALSVREQGSAAPASGAGGAAPAARPARSGTVEPGIDRPGADIAQIPITGNDPLACQALCAADGDCRAWTFVHPAEPSGEGMCWTKFEVPDALENPCCTLGVMDDDEAAAPPAGAPAATATLDEPATVAPGAAVRVAYAGPLHPGDWIDIITPGDDDNMGGGWAWDWATGAPVTLTAPSEPGPYLLRYVAEDPARGRSVLAQVPLIVAAAPPAPMADPGQPVAAPEVSTLAASCPEAAPEPCRHTDPDSGLVFLIAPGFGITQPVVHETPAGARAAVPTLALVRLADGAPVVWVNERQVTGLSCLTEGANEFCYAEAPDFGTQLALMLLNASLVGVYAGLDTPEPEPGDSAWDRFAGVWWVQVIEEGHPLNGLPIAVVDLVEVNATDTARGTFRSAPEFEGFAGLAGEATVGIGTDGQMRLHLFAADGPSLVMLGEAFGPRDWTGELGNPRPVTRATIRVGFSRVAEPGEAWEGAPWMTGEDDGMAAALQMARRVMGEALGSARPEDRAAIAALTGMLGAGSTQAERMLETMIATGRVKADAPLAQALPMLAPMLAGSALEGMTVGAALEMLRAAR